MQETTKLFIVCIGLIIMVGLISITKPWAQPKPGIANEDSSGSKLVFVVYSDKLDRLPEVIGEYKIYIRPQIKTEKVLSFDAWLVKEKLAYHSHMWRMPLSKDRWLFLFETTSNIWMKITVAWSKSDSSVSKPIPLSEITKLDVDLCQEVSALIMVKIPSKNGKVLPPAPTIITTCIPIVSDSGIPPKGTIPGTKVDCKQTIVENIWPKNSVVQCKESKDFYLLQNIYNGTWAISLPTKELNVATKVPLLPQTVQSTWIKPEVHKWKMCRVPVETYCQE